MEIGDGLWVALNFAERTSIVSYNQIYIYIIYIYIHSSSQNQVQVPFPMSKNISKMAKHLVVWLHSCIRNALSLSNENLVRLAEALTSLLTFLILTSLILTSLRPLDLGHGSNGFCISVPARGCTMGDGPHQIPLIWQFIAVWWKLSWLRARFSRAAYPILDGAK